MRRLLPLAALALSACSASTPLTDPPVALGDFSLGYTIVVAENAEKVPPSREATPEEWKAILGDAIKERFGRYEGDKLYHIAVNVDGYSLARPGIPVIAAPRSILVISANLWDDAAGRKLHEKPEQLTVFEEAGVANVVGTGFGRSPEEQMRALSVNAAGAIERWLVANRAAWFGAAGIAETPPGAAGPDGLPEPAESAPEAAHSVQ